MNLKPNKIALLFGLIGLLTDHSAAQHKKTVKPIDWNTISLSSADAKIFPRLVTKRIRRLGLSFYMQIGTFSCGLNKSIGLTGGQIQSHLNANPSLNTAVSNELGGTCFIPNDGLTYKGGEQKEYGILLGYFIKPKIEAILEAGIFMANFDGNFNVGVIPTGQTSSKIFRNQGSLKFNMNGTAFNAGLRYYPKGINGFYAELDLGVLNTSTKISESKIGNVSLGMSNKFNNLYYSQKLGAGISINASK